LQEAHKEHPEEMEKVYADTAEFAAGLKKLHIRDWLFISNPKWPMALFRALGLLLLLPLFIVSIIPTALLFIIPKIFLKSMIKDRMFNSSFHVGVSVFVSVPICLILPTVLLWIYLGTWYGLGYMVAFPFMFVMAWNYMRLFWRFIGTCTFIAHRNRKTINYLRELRKSIYERLDSLLK
jgi:small-conductance mechanosensitive channel